MVVDAFLIHQLPRNDSLSVEIACAGAGTQHKANNTTIKGALSWRDIT
ncbi:MAG TPA: hypothetical protein VFF84_06395 [Sphingobium sp.]|nr:hypothetical protein [Sphingobium sp.]